MKKKERKKKSCEEKAAKVTRDLPIRNSATLRRREEREGKKSLQMGKKIIIKDGAYTLRSIQFPHFIIVLSSSLSLFLFGLIALSSRLDPPPYDMAVWRERESPAPPLSPLAPLLWTFIPDIFTSYHSPLTSPFSQKEKKDSLRGWVTWPRGPRSIIQHLASAEYRFKSLATSWPIPEH